MGAQEWDERYSQAGYAYGSQPNDWLREQSGRLKAGAELLCLAEGEGRNAVFLAAQGLRVTAVDQSAVGLAKARALATERGVAIETVTADLGDYDLGQARWDAIVSIWCHLPSALRGSLYGRVARALKPGGLFVLETYGPGQIALGTGGPKEPDLLGSQARLQAELPGLDWLSAATLRRQVEEGGFHRGLSEVVQLLGRRPLEG